MAANSTVRETRRPETLPEQRSATAAASPPPRRAWWKWGLFGGAIAAACAAALFLRQGEVDEDSDARIEEWKQSIAAERRPASTEPGFDSLHTGAFGSPASFAVNAAASVSPDERDARLEAALIGTWDRPEEGKYSLTFLPDHTGTMVYLPNRKNWAALAFTKRLEIQVEWTLKHGHVDVKSVSGTPPRAFKIATLDRGDRKYYRIESLTAEKLVFHELKTEETKEWSRGDAAP